jgi:iron complex transport system substrate-binding protein
LRTLCFAFLLAGCGGSAPDAVPSHPRRILPMSVAVAEVVFGLVDRDRIVGLPEQAAVPAFSNLGDRIAGIPLVSAEAERLIALRPDLVILASYSPEGLFSVLQRAGIAVRAAAAPQDLEGLEAMIRSIGSWVGEPERAARMVVRLRSDLDDARLSIPPHRTAPRVVSLQGYGTTAGSGTSFDAWVRLAGGRNLAAERGIRGFQAMTVEHLFAWDPDVLVVGKDPVSGGSLRSTILTDPLFAPLRGRRILEIPFSHLTCLSQYGVETVRDLIEGLYP